MLTIPEFQSALKKSDREGFVVVALMFGGLLAPIALIETDHEFRAFFAERLRGPLPSVMVGVVAATPFVAMWLLAWLVSSHSGRDTRLHCPGCNKNLSLHRDYAIATRHCFHCNATVLRLPDEGTPEEAAVLRIAEFNVAVEETRGIQREAAVTLGVVLGGGPFIMLAAGLAVHGFLGRPFEGDPIDWLLLGSLAAIGFTAVIALILIQRRRSRDTRLRCPHCHSRLDDISMTVVSSRHCGRCGRRALAEPDPVDSVPKLWKADELKATAAALSNRSGISVMAPLAVMFGALLIFAPLRNWLQSLYAAGTDDQTAEIRTSFMVACLVGIPGIVTFVISRWRFRRWAALAKRPDCPHCCGNLTATGLVLLTGNCTHCGRRVLDAVPPPNDCVSSGSTV